MKYFSKKVKMYGMTFDSKTEASHYMKLKSRLDNGEIKNLQLQVEFEIIPKLVVDELKVLKTKTKLVPKVLERAAHYTADFVYEENGKIIIGEVKSRGTMLARDYPLRRKLIRKKIVEMNNSLGVERYEFREIVK